MSQTTQAAALWWSHTTLLIRPSSTQRLVFRPRSSGACCRATLLPLSLTLPPTLLEDPPLQRSTA